jgi:hypothetical protein
MPIIVSQRALRIAGRIGVNNLGDLFTVHRGLHSGIPPSCVYFFVAYWLRCKTDDRKKLDDHRTAEKAFGIESRGPGYIRCPACLLAKRVVKVRRCDGHRQKTIKAGQQTFRIR